MKRMMVFMAICVMLVTMVSCSTFSLPSNATPEQAKAAHCQDAVAAYNLSVVSMDIASPNLEASIYWKAYKAGAEIGLKLYCGN